MKLLKAVVSSLALISTCNVYADVPLHEATVSLKNDKITHATTPGTHVTTVDIDGKLVSMGFSGWSDNAGFLNDTLKSGTIDGWYNCDINEVGCTDQNRKYGYGIENSESGDSHSADNYSGGGDFDMFLFTFSEDVTLAGAGFSWMNGDNGTNEVTVAGISDINAFFSGTSATWQNVKANIISGTLGHFGINAKGANGLYESKFETITGKAQYWLVGAYNTIFDEVGSQSGDGVGLKLSTLDISIAKTTTTTEVSEPGALALMSLGLGLVLYRRKRRA